MTDTVRSETAGAGNTLRVLVYAALIVAAVWFLLPMFVMIITSIKSLDEIRASSAAIRLDGSPQPIAVQDLRTLL